MVSTISGVETGSVARYRFDVLHPVSESHLNHSRAITAIPRL